MTIEPHYEYRFNLERDNIIPSRREWWATQSTPYGTFFTINKTRIGATRHLLKIIERYYVHKNQTV